MSRHEFTRRTRREALKRSNMLCEATGTRYGLEPDQRCNAPLAHGVEFDHELPAELGGDNGLGNCVAACIKCHRWATANDIRRIRKADRIRDKASGAMKRPRHIMPGSRRSLWQKHMDGTVTRRGRTAIDLIKARQEYESALDEALLSRSKDKP